MGLDITGLSIHTENRIGGRVVTADANLDGVAWAQLRVFFGDRRQLIRAEGAFGPPASSASTPRLGLAPALDRYARVRFDPNKPAAAGPARLTPPDGVYHVTAAAPALARGPGGVLGPTYIITVTNLPAFMIPATAPSYVMDGTVD